MREKLVSGRSASGSGSTVNCAHPDPGDESTDLNVRVSALARRPRNLEGDHLGAERLVTLAQGFLVQRDFLQYGRRELGRDGAQRRVVRDLSRSRQHFEHNRSVQSGRTGMMRTCPPPGTGLESVEQT